MRVIVYGGKDILYQHEAFQVVLPGLDGEFSVLDFHQPFLYRLRNGIVKVEERMGQHSPELFPIKDGLARFTENTLVLFAELG
ncbi:MAG: F0F1 ATP synthase subunit epsilon [Candidatus Omnitrophota bacterium]